MILVIDQGDGFAHSLAHYLHELNAEALVRPGVGLTFQAVAALAPERIVLTSGPGRPEDAALALAIIHEMAGKVPILGIGLGNLCIAAAFGGHARRERALVRGQTALVYHHAKGLLRGLPSPFEAGCYHSLVVERHSLPQEMEITAQTVTGTIMAIRHRAHALSGLQFHPESIVTPAGRDLLRNFLN